MSMSSEGHEEAGPICPITLSHIHPARAVRVHGVLFDSRALYGFVVYYRRNMPMSPILHPCTRRPLGMDDFGIIYDAYHTQTRYDASLPPHNLSREEFVNTMDDYFHAPDLRNAYPHFRPRAREPCNGKWHEIGLCWAVLCMLFLMFWASGSR